MLKNLSYLILFMIFILMLSLASCKGNEYSPQEKYIIDSGRTMVYRTVPIELPENSEADFMKKLRYIDGRIYIPCFDDTVSLIDFTYSVDENGLNGAIEEYAGSINSYMTASYIDGALSVDIYNDEESRPYDAALIRYGNDGEVVFRKNIGDIFNLNTTRMLDDYYTGRNDFVTDLISDGDKIFIAYDGKIAVLNGDGVAEGMINAGGRVKFFRKSDGNLMSMVSVNGKYSIKEIDTVRAELVGKFEIPAELLNDGMELYNGAGYDVYIKTSDGLYGFTEGNEHEMLINWVASDIMYSSVKDIIVIDSQNYFLLGYNITGNSSGTAVKLTMLKPHELNLKEEIIIAYTSGTMNYSLNESIISFNRKNEKYHISLENYSRYNLSDDNTLAFKLLSADISIGKIPDMLIITDDIPASSMIVKNMFADLNTFGDNGFSADSLVDCCRYPLETNDKKLFYIPLVYFIDGYFCKSELFPHSDEWNLETAFERLKNVRNPQQFINGNAAIHIFDYLIKNSLDEFIDYETAACSFDSKLFTDILEYTKCSFTIYKKDIEWRSGESIYKDESVLLYSRRISSISDCLYISDKFGVPITEVTAIGSPSVNGGVLDLDMSCGIAVMSSANRAGASEYLKYITSDEYQLDNESVLLPITKSALKLKLDDFMSRVCYYRNGEYNSADNNEKKMLSNGYVKVDIAPENREFFEKCLTNVAVSDEHTEKIYSLIFEEFFEYIESPDMTASDCAEKIQNRVGIYVSENS